MIRRFLAAGLAVSSSAALAASPSFPSGPTLTTGSSSTPFSVHGANLNPAASSRLVGEGEGLRFNYLPSLGFQMELGDVNNFVDDLDELIEILDDPTTAQGTPQEVLDRFNVALDKMGQDGYLQIGVYSYLPFLPVHWRSDLLKGTVSVSANISGEARVGVLASDLTFNDQTQEFNTDTALYLKSGLEQKISVGYSRPLSIPGLSLGENSNLQVGARLNLYRIELSKQILLLDSLEGREVGDVISDEYDNNMKTTSGLGLDLGVLWTSGRYAAGLTLANVNQPSFDFGSVGANCATRDLGDFEREDCEAAARFGEEGKFEVNEKHKKKAHLNVEGSYAIFDNWMVMGSLDLTKYDNLVGAENQWLTIGTAFYPQSWFLPDARLGYRKNLAGSELSSVALGLGFGGFTLDISMGLDDIEIDGSSSPRSMGFAIGFEERF